MPDSPEAISEVSRRLIANAEKAADLGYMLLEERCPTQRCRLAQELVETNAKIKQDHDLLQWQRAIEIDSATL
jgi:midasin (ATPase involved in ribosome maturation)